jgi:hypothetical protein
VSELERPTLTEAAAVIAAAVAYAETLDPDADPPADELPALLDELELSIRRLRAVTS